MAEPAVIDAAARRRALDVEQSFIVQAPAGSGKTELLTQRYLRLLAHVRDPEEICAITFTRKAAGEMRQRILAALRAAGGEPPNEPHRRLTWSLARDALARDRALDWGIGRNPNRLRIQTFDSLSHALARQMPLLSELGATPATTERPAPYYAEAARATLRMLEDPQLGPDLACLLRHLDNRRAQLIDLLSGMLARRDQWLAHVLGSPDAAAIERALQDSVTGHLGRLRGACPADWLHRLVGIAHDAARRLDADPTQGGLAVWRDPAGPPAASWPDLPRWQGLAELLLTRDGRPRRQWNTGLGFAAPTERGIGADEKALRSAAKQQIAELASRLVERPALLALWDGVRRLPPSGLDAQQQRVLTSLLRVLRYAAAQLLLVFQEHAEVDFAEIQMRAQRALGSPEQPTDLALALDYRLQHLLVDEFQDTSSSQHRLLGSLIAGWQPGDGRTLFAVGDPMQSIYRFREAEVGLYLAARAHGIGMLRLEALTLEVNFRSHAAIVDWVNDSFAQVFPDSAEPGRGAVPYAPAVAFDRTAVADAVQVHAFAGHDGPAEAAQVVALLRAALTEQPDGRVAILARARAHLHDIAAALKAAGLAFQAVDVDPLAGQPVVKDLRALTRALLHPADRLSWLVVLRAPWLGLALDDLLRLAEPSAACLLSRLRDPQVRARLSDDGRRRIERLLQIIDPQLPARGRRPLRQWVEGIWLLLGGRAVIDDRAATDAQAFLALLDAHEQAGGLIDFAQLDAAIDDLYAAPDGAADGRIQLMTMHKAKGLEFDTVILPGLGRPPRSTPGALLNWLEQTDSAGRTQLLMAPIRAAGQETEPISQYLRDLDKDKDRLETTRLLYVAATRAKRRLHLLGHVAVNPQGTVADTPARDSLLGQLWPALRDRFADLRAGGAAPNPAPATRTAAALRRLAADWSPAGEFATLPRSITDQPTVEAQIEFEWASDTARHVGTLVHRYLERIARDGPADWPAQRVASLHEVVGRGLRQLGVDETELESATAKAIRALRQTLHDPTGRWILEPHAEARCEWPLTLHEGLSRQYVIDRSFVDDQGVRWIIDYKTGEHLDEDAAGFLDREQQRYREQLETYGRVVRLLDDRPIRLALYFPLFPAFRVWDYND